MNFDLKAVLEPDNFVSANKFLNISPKPRCCFNTPLKKVAFYPHLVWCILSKGKKTNSVFKINKYYIISKNIHYKQSRTHHTPLLHCATSFTVVYHSKFIPLILYTALCHITAAGTLSTLGTVTMYSNETEESSY